MCCIDRGHWALNTTFFSHNRHGTTQFTEHLFAMGKCKIEGPAGDRTISCRLTSLITHWFPSGKRISAKEAVDAEQRCNVRESKISWIRKKPDLLLLPADQQSRDRNRPEQRLPDEQYCIYVREPCQHHVRKVRSSQENRDHVPKELVRQDRETKKAESERIHDVPIPPNVSQRLGDDAHPHFQLFTGNRICSFRLDIHLSDGDVHSV